MSISSAPAACPSCMFGATSTSLLSFSYHAVETITVNVIPHVTVYTNGTRKTSFESITQTKTDWVGSGNDTSKPKTFTNKNDITWTVGDATLTYPTTYVQYLGFEGVAVTSDDVETCAELTDASSVELPSSTQCAPFIYALVDAVNATGVMQLPTPLLDYLAQLPEISDQFNGLPLTGCAPLTWTPPASVTAEATASTYVNASSSSALPRTSSVPVPLGTGSVPAPQTTQPSSSGTPHLSSPMYSEPSQSSPPSNASYVSPPVRPTQTLPHQSSPKGPESVTTNTRTGSPAPVNPHLPEPTAGLPSSYPAGGSYSQEPSPSSIPPPAYTTDFSLTHTTAFIIDPITGTTVYTTISGSKGDHTKNPGGGPGGYDTTKDGHEPGHTPDHNGGQPDGTRGHTGGDSGPTQGQHPAEPHHTGGSEVTPAEHGHAPNPTPPVYTHGHTTVRGQPGGGVVVGSKTVRPGHKVTIGSGTSRTVVALQTEGGHTKLIIGGNTYNPRPQKPHATPAAGPRKPHVSVGVITTDGHIITAIRSGKSVVIAEGSSIATIRPGGKVTFEGQTISVPHRGGSVMVNGKGAQLTAGGDSQAVVTAGGHEFTAVDMGKSVILKDGSSTVIVKDGSQTVFHGQTVSVLASGNKVVIKGKTTTLSAASESTATASVIINAGGHTITAVDRSGSVVLKDAASTATVKDGQVVTFEEQKISVLPNGSAVIVNGATTSFKATTTTTGVGDYIKGGLGRTTSSPSPSATAATGSASSVRSNTMSALCATVLGLVGVLAIL